MLIFLLPMWEHSLRKRKGTWMWISHDVIKSLSNKQPGKTGSGSVLFSHGTWNNKLGVRALSSVLSSVLLPGVGAVCQHSGKPGGFRCVVYAWFCKRHFLTNSNTSSESISVMIIPPSGFQEPSEFSSRHREGWWITFFSCELSPVH